MGILKNLFGNKDEPVQIKKVRKNPSVIDVRLVGCDVNRANLYYDESKDLFYDWIIPHGTFIAADDPELFRGHILVIGDSFYPNKKMYDCEYDRKRDIRYLKVLDQDVIMDKFVAKLYTNSQILCLKNGMITINDILITSKAYTYSGFSLLYYKYWDVNGRYTLANIFNKLEKDYRKSFIDNHLRNIDYMTVDVME